MRTAYQTDLSEAERALIEPHLPAPDAPGQPRPPAARDTRRRLLHRARRLRLASTSPRLPAVEDRLLIFPSLAHRRHLAEVARGLHARARVRLGRDPHPSAGIVDSQSVKTTGVGRSEAPIPARR